MEIISTCDPRTRNIFSLFLFLVPNHSFDFEITNQKITELITEGKPKCNRNSQVCYLAYCCSLSCNAHKTPGSSQHFIEGQAIDIVYWQQTAPPAPECHHQSKTATLWKPWKICLKNMRHTWVTVGIAVDDCTVCLLHCGKIMSSQYHFVRFSIGLHHEVADIQIPVNRQYFRLERKRSCRNAAIKNI